MSELLDVLEKLNTQDLKRELTKLRAIKDWALLQACGFGVGDKVEILDSLEIDSSSGWWTYREALAPGAVGTANEIDFNAHYGYWYGSVVLDREWSCGSANDGTRYWHGPAESTPEGYNPPSKYERETYPDGRRHTFWIPVRHLRTVAAEVSR